MRRMINFGLGFIIGILLSAAIILLVTPQNAAAIRLLFIEAYNKKKTDIEAELGLETNDL